MITIQVADETGAFAENKRVAGLLRDNFLLPALGTGDDDVELDFQGVELATQSFVHAFLSSVIRARGVEVLDRLVFSNCTEELKALIRTVVEYSDLSDMDDPEGKEGRS